MKASEVIFGSTLFLTASVGGAALGNHIYNGSDQIPVDIEAIRKESAQVGVGMLASQMEGSCEQVALHELIMMDPNVSFPDSPAAMAANLDLACVGDGVDHAHAAEVAFSFFERDKELRTDIGEGIKRNKDIKHDKQDLTGGVSGTAVGAIGSAGVLLAIYRRRY